MKLTATLISLALAGSAVAQLDQLPPCARECAEEFLTGDVGGCGIDIPCICGNDQFLGGIACCLADDCDAAAQSTAVSVALALCSGAGVTGLPTAVSCTNAPATTTSGPADTTAETTAPPSTGTDSATAATDGPTDAPTETSQSTNYGPRQTAGAGLGAIGGIIAAVALL
ncbi:hypothetical protein MFIFM68171_08908 [Madurella fahalii]|uniref:CFEM domain-containing protein n=1 Tax=Madurella fahalii TaxID=1157608 RepID=A0ABQ0GLQ6_9PEZI